MRATTTAARAAAAAATTLALVATGAPALAGAADKPGGASTGSWDHGVLATDITQGLRIDPAGGMTKYSYNNPTLYWSVTAVQANENTRKADIALYADEANTDSLAKSSLAGKAVDFVVVDSNHAQWPNTWYPTVISRGTGTFTVQNDTNAEILVCGTSTTITLGPDDIVHAHDVYLSEGVEYAITVRVPRGSRAGLHLMTSTLGDEASWYQSRSQGREDIGKGTLSINSTGDDDWHGLILTQSQGDGGAYTFDVPCPA